jgi:hypothetical protein
MLLQWFEVATNNDNGRTWKLMLYIETRPNHSKAHEDMRLRILWASQVTAAMKRPSWFHLQQPLGGPWFLNDVDKTLYNYLLKWSWIILSHQDPNAASSSWLQYSKLRCLPICCSVWLGLFPSLYGLMIYALFCCFVSRVSSSGIQECKTCKFLLYFLYEANMVGPILTHPCFLGY